MKIISKFKDFYDYLAQDYDADITYVRQPKIIYEYGSIYSTYGYPEYSPVTYISYNEGDILLSNSIFGIYPNLYSIPVIKICLKSMGCNHFDFSYPGKPFVESLAGLDYKDSSEILQAYCMDLMKTLPQYINFPKSFNNQIGRPKTGNKYYQKEKLTYDAIIHVCKKIEIPEIFNYFKSPVFLDNDLLHIDCYNNGKLESLNIEKPERQPRNSRIIYLDVPLQYIEPGLLKYWYDDLNNINTYNDIENFLWSQKQEPISEPTNKQKIVNHGFDLKTSFRKM